MKPKYICLIFLIIFIIFSIIVYNLLQSGNNIISKSKEDIIEKILDTKEYNAKIKVTIYSNKNQNEYEIEQSENIVNNYSFEKVTSRGTIEGLTVELNNNKLSIKNTKLNLEKIYENYQPIVKNYLFLSNFINELSEDIEEKEEEIILKNKNNNLHKKELYISKKSGLPQKMIIIDKEQNVKAIIEYIEIELK